MKTVKNKLSRTRSGLKARASTSMVRTVESFTKEERKKEGWLTKRGSLAKTWKLRYFILTSDSLYYFRAPTTEENQSNGGSGDFLACLNLDEYNSIAETNIKGKDHCFCLFHNEDKGTRSLIMSATSQEEKDSWIHAIQTVFLRKNAPRIVVEDSKGFYEISDEEDEKSEHNDHHSDSDSESNDANKSSNSPVISPVPTNTPNDTPSLTKRENPTPTAFIPARPSSASTASPSASAPSVPSSPLPVSPSPSLPTVPAATSVSSPSSSPLPSPSVFKAKPVPSPNTAQRNSASNRYPTFDPFTEDQKLLMSQLPDNEFARAKLVPPTSKTDAMYKVILVGDSGVGKTNLIRVFNGEGFKSNIVATVGADFISKTYSLPQEDTNVKIQIWDTAGQERYHSVMKAYYRGCTGALIVFDVNQRPTFERVEYWLKELEINCNSEVLVVGIIGNKADLDQSTGDQSVSSSSSSSAVSLQEAAGMALSQEMFFVDTSALSGKNVHKAFLTLFQEIHDVVNKRRKSRSHTTLSTDVKDAYGLNNNISVSTPSKDENHVSTDSTSTICFC